MSVTSRRSFAWSAVILPALAAINLALIFFLRNIPATCAVDVLIYSTSLIRKWDLSWLEIVSFGSALGLGVTPTIFTLLASFGSSGQTAIVLSCIDVGLLATAFFVRTKQKAFISGFTRAWIVCWGSLLLVSIFLQFYNFNQLHLTPSGGIEATGLFGIDIPYLVGQFSSLKSYSDLRDLHQLAQPMYYHDFVYRFIIVSQQFSKTDLFTFTINGASLFNYLLLAISTYALVYPLSHKRTISWLAVASVFLLGSFTGTEQGSFALSPSFVWGTIIFLNLLQLLSKYFAKPRTLPEIDAALLFALLLMILSRSKISTFAVLIAGLGVMILILLINKRTRDAVHFGGALLISLSAFALSSSGKNPLMPGDDFLTGAPLLGYANHLASLLHVSLGRLNPIGHGFLLSARSLLIIPYFAFHLVRFIALDGRILVVLFAILFFRKRLFGLLPKVPRPLLWLLLALIPIGYALPVLYSPAWYPLAFSFYAPLVSVMASLVLTILIASAIWEDRELKYRTLYLSIFGICLLGCFAGNTIALSQERATSASDITSERIAALHYLRDHSSPQNLVATRRYDLVTSDTAHDESYFLYSAFSERAVISEGAAYGALLGAVATIDSSKGLHHVPIAQRLLAERRAVIDSIYLSHDLLTVRQILQSRNVKFIIEDKEIEQHLAVDPRTVADPLFDNTSMTIWKVR
jgi:hypothetical protein